MAGNLSNLEPLSIWDQQRDIVKAGKDPELFHHRHFGHKWDYFEWYRLFDKMKKRKRLLLAPPGIGKTTKVHEELIRALAPNRKLRAGLISKVGGRAKNYMEAAGSTLKSNTQLINDYGSFYVERDPRYQWNSTQIRVRGSDPTIPTPTLTNLGAGGQLESLRYNFLIADDPIDVHTYHSPTETRRMIDNLAIWEDRLEPGGWLWIIGHRFGLNDYYQYIIDNRDDFEVLILDAEQPGHKLLCPERWIDWDNFTKEVKGGKRDWEYLTHFRQKAVAPGDSQFNWSWISGGDKYQFVLESTIPKLPRVTVADMAYTTSKKADWSVAMTGQRFGSGIVVTAMDHWQISGGWSSKFAEFANNSGSRKVCPEINNAKTFGEELKQYVVRNGLLLSVEPINSTGNKIYRIGELEVPSKQGRIWFTEEVANTKVFHEFKTQFTLFPNVEHVDLLDTLQMLWNKLMKGSFGRAQTPVVFGGDPNG